mmetsp:Transcript_13713/g.21899  ORF Transcript_13713/g.21899 Transcript_13713/m.21899 type:complete len:293 (-) Transcript_13713:109-987(-)
MQVIASSLLLLLLQMPMEVAATYAPTVAPSSTSSSSSLVNLKEALILLSSIVLLLTSLYCCVRQVRRLNSRNSYPNERISGVTRSMNIGKMSKNSFNLEKMRRNILKISKLSAVKGGNTANNKKKLDGDNVNNDVLSSIHLEREKKRVLDSLPTANEMRELEREDDGCTWESNYTSASSTGTNQTKGASLASPRNVVGLTESIKRSHQQAHHSYRNEHIESVEGGGGRRGGNPHNNNSGVYREHQQDDLQPRIAAMTKVHTHKKGQRKGSLLSSYLGDDATNTFVGSWRSER